MRINPISTISDVENLVQSGIEALRNLPLSEEIALALQYIAPEGYLPVIQLEEHGRKKRSTAAASNWSPETGEIHIYFEKKKSDSGQPKGTVAPILSPSIAAAPPPQTVHGARASAARQVTSVEPVTAAEVAQCCQALNQAENSGRHFIAIKWFRDAFLTAQGFPWTASDQRRQQVLAHAIETGRIQSKKIPNPRSPQFPTTTITLNRSVSTPAIAPRFQPVPVRGEPVSATLIRDRGTL